MLLFLQILRGQSVNTAPNKQSVLDYIERCKKDNGVWPSIPFKPTNQVSTETLAKGVCPNQARLPILLPFLVHKYKTMSASHLYTRRKLTKAGAGIINGLRDAIKKAYTDVDEAGAGNVEQNITVNIRKMFYYALPHAPASEEERTNMAKAMVIPFMALTEKVTAER
jgi:hypothetical protein